MKRVSVDYAAKLIGVSSATIRNWAKAGYIQPVSLRPMAFLEKSVMELKKQLSSEAFGKLTTRANKAASSLRFFPEEYAANTALISHLAQISEYVKEKELKIELVMFLAALRLLIAKGEVILSGCNDIFNLNSFTSWHRQAVKEVMVEWRACLETEQLTERYSYPSEPSFIYEEEDYLGLLYQSISSEGCKSEQGSYFTPTQLVMDSLACIAGPIKTFLDPCCGTGKFLIHAAQQFSLEPENIFGFDIDRIAVYIAKINLLLSNKEREFTPRIYWLDSLSALATGEIFCETNNLLNSIDAIATNPPWGAYKNATSKGQLSSVVRSGETFSLFLEKSIRLLKNGGMLSFILPESILTVRAHSDIRTLLLHETTITKISLLGRQFTGVFTPVIRLNLINEQPSNQCMVTVEHEGGSHKVAQRRFGLNTGIAFDIQVRSYEEDVLERIYSVKHLTLTGNAEWALGIVTGDNKKHMLNMPTPGAEPILRGSDIHPFFLEEPNSYIYFSPKHYQQVASEKYYRATEKLIYKFISKRLVFAYDNQQRLSLNSANILIPSIPDMSQKVALAFLNSNVFQYIFIKKFSTHKVLRGDLEKLPFPNISHTTHDAIERLVDVAIASRRIPAELEKIVSAAFNLTEKDVALITEAVQG